MNIEIVKAKPEDAEGIFNVQKMGWLDTYTNIEQGITAEDIENKFSNESERIQRWRDSIIKSELEDPTTIIWVAKDGEKVIGFISPHKEDVCNSLGVYVLTEYQRQGIGKQLMHVALDWLGEEKPIKFECVAYNTKALNFYKKNGFQINESVRTEGSKLPSGAIIPTVEMVRK